MSGWVLSVGQLNEYVRKQLAGDPILNRLRVRGEISGYKRHTSGHLYFSIKDDQARVQCVMFRQHALGLAFEPRDGMRVVVSGAASLYTQTGGFQIYCEGIEREGAGELYLQFEALKEKLSAEGLFDPARKKTLPMLPRALAIVTSRTGAALRDMLRVIARRYPAMRVVVCPAQVQGEGAARDIARALDLVNANACADVILCGRGGGSIEDLWAFNEEIVARAIARSRIPIISCVGHETDFTIADFVADVRAATPSVAAELAVPMKAELVGDVRALCARMRRAQDARVALARARVDKLRGALGKPQQSIERRRIALSTLSDRMGRAQRARLFASEARLEALRRALSALSPDAVLGRGYALISDARGLITNADGLCAGQTVRLRLTGGQATAEISSVERESAHGSEEENHV